MQDYILRLIQQVAQMVAAIMGHRQAGRGEEAEQEIERACLQTAGVPLSLVRQASPEALRAFLQTGGPQRLTRDILLAEILMQDAELLQEGGYPGAARHSRAHAFCLIADAVDALPAEDAALYRSKLDDLAVELQGGHLDPYAAKKLEAWLQHPQRASGLSGSVHPG